MGNIAIEYFARLILIMLKKGSCPIFQRALAPCHTSQLSGSLLQREFVDDYVAEIIKARFLYCATGCEPDDKG